MAEELENEPGTPDESEETQWLEKRLDAMDAVLQSLTQQLEALPVNQSSSLLEAKLEALQTKLEALTIPSQPSNHQQVSDLESKIAELEAKIVSLTPQPSHPAPNVNTPVAVPAQARTLRKL